MSDSQPAQTTSEEAPAEVTVVQEDSSANAVAPPQDSSSPEENANVEEQNPSAEQAKGEEGNAAQEGKSTVPAEELPDDEIKPSTAEVPAKENVPAQEEVPGEGFSSVPSVEESDQRLEETSDETNPLEEGAASSAEENPTEPKNASEENTNDGQGLDAHQAETSNTAEADTPSADQSENPEPGALEGNEEAADNKDTQTAGIDELDDSMDVKVADESQDNAKSDGGDTHKGEGETAPTSREADAPLEASSQPKPENSDRAAGRKRLPTNPLDLQWAIGCDCTSVGSCHYLKNGEREEIFFTTGNTAVILAEESNEQVLLQGHRNTIQKVCKTKDNRWLATADSGTDAALVVWDSIMGTPVRTWFSDVFPSVCAIAFSSDGTILAVASSTGDKHVVSLWDWSDPEATDPIASVVLSLFKSPPSELEFSNSGHSIVAATNTSQCALLHFEFESQSSHVQELGLHNIDRTVNWGSYGQSIFIYGESLMVGTTTSEGYLLMWDVIDRSSGTTPCKKFIQLFKVAISFATYTPNRTALVVGGADGKIRYFDDQFRIMGWLDDLDLGPITSISFALPAPPPKNRRHSLTSVGLKPVEFEVPDYIASTRDGKIIKVSNEYGEQSSQVVIAGHTAELVALAAHPIEPQIAISSLSGRLQIWDYTYHVDVVSRDLPQLSSGGYPTALAFSNTGETLVVGYSDGSITLLDSTSLSILSESSRFTEFDEAITKIVFAHDSSHFAISSADHYVGVFRVKPEDYDNPFEFVGKHRSHSAKITDIAFGTEPDGQSSRLLSIGEDRMMAEYDLSNSSFGEGLLLGAPSGPARIEIEQTAAPEAFAWYPNDQGEEFLIVANSEFKFKLLNSTTKMCRKTVLASTLCGTPLTKMKVLPAYPKPDSQRVLAYSTGEMIGLSLLPLDGNANSNMAAVGHSSNIASMVCSNDGRYIFTAAGRAVNMWSVNTHILAASSRLAGEGIEPFVKMLEGGRQGQLFKDLEDFFYYAQVEYQGVNSMEERKVTDYLPLTEVPKVLRALGYYPSDREIMNITNEVKFSKMIETKQMVDTVDLETLIRIYVNHRPAIDLTPSAIVEAFNAIGENGEIGTADLVSLLKDSGEQMTEDEMFTNLGKLLGTDTLLDILGPKTNAMQFAGEILGF